MSYKKKFLSAICAVASVVSPAVVQQAAAKSVTVEELKKYCEDNNKSVIGNLGIAEDQREALGLTKEEVLKWMVGFVNRAGGYGKGGYRENDTFFLLETGDEEDEEDEEKVRAAIVCFDYGSYIINKKLGDVSCKDNCSAFTFFLNLDGDRFSFSATDLTGAGIKCSFPGFVSIPFEYFILAARAVGVNDPKDLPIQVKERKEEGFASCVFPGEVYMNILLKLLGINSFFKEDPQDLCQTDKVLKKCFEQFKGDLNLFGKNVKKAGEDLLQEALKRLKSSSEKNEKDGGKGGKKDNDSSQKSDDRQGGSDNKKDNGNGDSGKDSNLLKIGAPVSVGLLAIGAGVGYAYKKGVFGGKKKKTVTNKAKVVKKQTRRY